MYLTAMASTLQTQDDPTVMPPHHRHETSDVLKNIISLLSRTPYLIREICIARAGYLGSKERKELDTLASAAIKAGKTIEQEAERCNWGGYAWSSPDFGDREAADSLQQVYDRLQNSLASRLEGLGRHDPMPKWSSLLDIVTEESYTTTRILVEWRQRTSVGKFNTIHSSGTLAALRMRGLLRRSKARSYERKLDDGEGTQSELSDRKPLSTTSYSAVDPIFHR